MKNLLRTVFLLMPILFLASCSDDDDNGTLDPVNTVTYDLGSVSNPSINGVATFIDNGNGTSTIDLQLQGTSSGGQHPAHIHFNTAAEGGAIALDLGTVDGDTGFSTVTFSTLNDGTAIDFAGLIAFDGYINVHLSENDLDTLVAQGDIGQNELTGTEKSYVLGTVDVDGINGTATFAQRANGETLATIQLNGTPDDGMHPAHIHVGDATQMGVIAIGLGVVDGATGTSSVNISTLDFNDDDDSNDVAITYTELLNYDGYINVHLSADELETLVAQGDIGQNELTGTEKSYVLGTVDVDGINGTATFAQRANGETLATIQLNGTPDDGMHPAHIHVGDATQMGVIAIGLGVVDGATGTSSVNISTLDFNDDDASNDVAITYTELLNYDGYINVHLSTDELGTLVAQGDIGQNEIINSISYDLNTLDVAGISGSITFDERANSEIYSVIQLEGTPVDGMHPAHIHMNSAEETGPVVVTLGTVNGETGIGTRTFTTFNDEETPFTYSDLIDYDGYVNVHLSMDEIETIVAQGNIGSNQ
ncbi:MAG: CHRD domain-containing protein [Psychroserpens sp.]|uniref:CHRD domain-containing protein n=1 Tax=Psychroserpens sp. TaxID=2020870 RepID=UPI003C742BBC